LKRVDAATKVGYETRPTIAGELGGRWLLILFSEARDMGIRLTKKLRGACGAAGAVR